MNLEKHLEGWDKWAQFDVPASNLEDVKALVEVARRVADPIPDSLLGEISDDPQWELAVMDRYRSYLLGRI